MSDLVGLVRATHVAATLSLFGSFAFLLLVAPRGWRRALGLRPWLLGSAAVALVFALAWALAVAHEVGGAAGTLDGVLSSTAFGQNTLVRMVLVAAAAVAALFRPNRLAAAFGTFFGGIAVTLLAGAGHAAALPDDAALLPRSVEMLHLLAAGLWLGGLFPLWRALALDGAAPSRAAQRFSRVASVAVAAVALTALGNAVLWLGSPAALVGTPYGRWMLVKAALFTAMLALAALNRWRLTPALAGAEPSEAARRALRRSVALEALLGLAVVAAAGMLASTAPPIHHG